MIQQAIDSPDPVLFFEPKRQYHSGRGEVDPEAPLTAAPARFDQAAVLRAGELVTLVGFGPTISTLLKVADVLAEEQPQLWRAPHFIWHLKPELDAILASSNRAPAGNTRIAPLGSRTRNPTARSSRSTSRPSPSPDSVTRAA